MPDGGSLPRRPKHVAPSLAGFASAHGEDGIDGDSFRVEGYGFGP